MPATQPAPPAPSAEDMSAVIAPFQELEGPLLPMLHALQESFGCVPDGAIDILAQALNISRAEVHGVVSFYHDFKSLQKTKYEVKVCRAEACQAMGSAKIAEDAMVQLNTDWHGTTMDGAVTVEPVYCLGLCANGPAALVNGTPVAGLDTARLVALIKGLGT